MFLRLIQDSLGGNTRTYIIATLSPTYECMEESISTLKFADRAKQVSVGQHHNLNEHKPFILIPTLSPLSYHFRFPLIISHTGHGVRAAE